jgi:hypothetical protein
MKIANFIIDNAKHMLSQPQAPTIGAEIVQGIALSTAIAGGIIGWNMDTSAIPLFEDAPKVIKAMAGSGVLGTVGVTAGAVIGAAADKVLAKLSRAVKDSDRREIEKRQSAMCTSL